MLSPEKIRLYLLTLLEKEECGKGTRTSRVNFRLRPADELNTEFFARLT